MSAPPTFLTLPLEIRDAIYDLAFDRIRRSRVIHGDTIYTKSAAPLLYVDEIITNDLMPRLYRNHVLLLALQEPSVAPNSVKPVIPDFERLSFMRKQRSTKLSVRIIQAERVQITDVEEMESIDSGDFCDSWRKVKEFSNKFVDVLLNVKDQFPSLHIMEFIFRESFPHLWSAPLTRLKNGWDGLRIYTKVSELGDSRQNRGQRR